VCDDGDARGIVSSVEWRAQRGFATRAEAAAFVAAQRDALLPGAVVDIAVEHFVRLDDAVQRRLKGFVAGALDFGGASDSLAPSDAYEIGVSVGQRAIDRVPAACRRASREARARLLDGVQHGARAVRRRGATELCVARQCAFDVLFVARSLGLRATTVHGKRGTSAELQCIRLSTVRTFDMRVELLPTPGDYFGFEVDGNQRFVLGDSFAVTHNCFRLFTAWAYAHELAESNIPEIQRTNLGNTVLLLKSLGINDLINFDFLDAPPAESLIRALEELYALGALNDRGQLTKVGRKMSEFPLDPKMSRALIGSEQYGCTEEVLIIMSMLSCGGSLWYAPQDKKLLAETARESFNRPGGDHLALLNLYTQWRDTNYSMQWTIEQFCQHRSLKRARDIYDQILNLLERTEVPLTSTGGDSIAIRKAIACGYFQNVARLSKGGTYNVAKSKTNASIHPSSSLKNELPRVLIYDELVFTTKEYMRNCIEIESKFLVEVAPHVFQAKKEEEDA
jgi:hypothetical protein